MRRHSMILLVLSLCLIAGFAFPEWAAGQSLVPPSPPAAAPAPASGHHDWTGFYAGANLGSTWGAFDGPVTAAAVPGAAADSATFHVSDSSLTMGGQIGYNRQFGRWVAGPEADMNFLNLNRTETLTTTDGITFVPGDSFNAASHFQASLRDRFGYATGDWLIYVTGGVSFATVRMTANFIQTVIPGPITFPASSGADNETLTAPTIGAGVEHTLWNHWSVAGEYRFTPYGRQTFNLGIVAASFNGLTRTFINSPVSANVGPQPSEIVAKLNFKF